MTIKPRLGGLGGGKNFSFDAIHPVVYIEVHKHHYVSRLTHPVYIIFSNTAYFDEADLLVQKLKTQDKNVKFCEISQIIKMHKYKLQLYNFIFYSFFIIREISQNVTFLS
jgi:hypothetical protein